MKPLTIEEITESAQQLQQQRLRDFGAIAFAFAGGKFKIDEYFTSAKRFERNWIKCDAAAALSATTAGLKGTLTFTNGTDRWRNIGALVLVIDAAGTRMPEGTLHQIHRLLTAEIKRQNGSSTINSARAYSVGVEGTLQGAAADDDGFGGEVQHFNRLMRPDGQEHMQPIDVLNPGEALNVILEGITGTTLAESFSGVISVTGHILCLDAVKG